MKIETLLQNYRKNKGLLALFKAEKEKLRSGSIPDHIKYLPQAGFNLIPSAPTNKITKIIESAGIKLAESSNRNEEKIKELEEKIKELEEKIEKIKILVNTLNEYERFIIESYYFSGFDTYTIVSEFQKKFNSLITFISLKRRRRKALKKMTEIYRESKLIRF